MARLVSAHVQVARHSNAGCACCLFRCGRTAVRPNCVPCTRWRDPAPTATRRLGRVNSATNSSRFGNTAWYRPSSSAMVEAWTPRTPNPACPLNPGQTSEPTGSCRTSEWCSVGGPGSRTRCPPRSFRTSITTGAGGAARVGGGSRSRTDLSRTRWRRGTLGLLAHVIAPGCDRSPAAAIRGPSHATGSGPASSAGVLPRSCRCTPSNRGRTHPRSANAPRSTDSAGRVPETRWSRQVVRTGVTPPRP
jgi:hypothetical protein